MFLTKLDLIIETYWYENDCNIEGEVKTTYFENYFDRQITNRGKVTRKQWKGLEKVSKANVLYAMEMIYMVLSEVKD